MRLNREEKEERERERESGREGEGKEKRRNRLRDDYRLGEENGSRNNILIREHLNVKLSSRRTFVARQSSNRIPYTLLFVRYMSLINLQPKCASGQNGLAFDISVSEPTEKTGCHK